MGTSEAPDVERVLEQLLRGPVVTDRRTYYALVPAGTSETWARSDAPCSGRGSALVTPRIDRTRPCGLYWAAPPRAVGELCDPAGIAELLRHAERRAAAQGPR